MEQVWRPLIEEAGFSDPDMPKTHDAYFDFFQTVQDKLRSKGSGYSDWDIRWRLKRLMPAPCSITSWWPMGHRHRPAERQTDIDDSAVQKAAITALERLTTPYKKGYVPPGAINWGDVDNNNAFFAKQIVMTPNATISIAVAQMEKADQYYKQVITQGIPLGNDGKPVPGVLAVAPCLIPKGAKNIDAAKDLLRSFIKPDNLNQYLKETRGRFLPVMMVEYQIGSLLAGPC